MPDFGVTPAKQQALVQRMLMLKISEADLFEQFIRGSGRGGQKINKASTCVLLKHLPSGVVVRCQRERELSVNRYLARRLLADRIEKLRTGSVAEKDKKLFKIRKQKARRKRKAKAKYQKTVEGE